MIVKRTETCETKPKRNNAMVDPIRCVEIKNIVNEIKMQYIG